MIRCLMWLATKCHGLVLGSVRNVARCNTVRVKLSTCTNANLKAVQRVRALLIVSISTESTGLKQSVLLCRNLVDQSRMSRSNRLLPPFSWA